MSQILEAAVQEIKEAYVQALQKNQQNEAKFWKLELLVLLEKLSANTGHTEPDSRTDSGEQQGD
jgi:hypothetical protein